jgi:hypothetical protein
MRSLRIGWTCRRGSIIVSPVTGIGPITRRFLRRAELEDGGDTTLARDMLVALHVLERDNQELQSRTEQFDTTHGPASQTPGDSRLAESSRDPVK